MEIDIKAFIGAAFGMEDSESGYGAQYPRSRDVRSFFEGRHGRVLSTLDIATDFDKKSVIRVEAQKTAYALAEDLENLAAQIREMLPEGCE